MKSTQEEGLDNIFKQGLQEPGQYAGYRERDWEAFEQLLDQKKGKRPLIFWLRIASGMAAMLLLGFGWLLMQQGIHHVKPIKQTADVSTKAKGEGGHMPATGLAAPNNTIATDLRKDNTGTSGGNENQTAGSSNKNTSSVKPAYVLAISRRPQKDNSFFPLSDPAARRDSAVLVPNDLVNSKRYAVVLAAFSEMILPENQFTDREQSMLKMDLSLPEPQTGPVRDVTGQAIDRRPQYAITVLGSSNINGVSSFGNSKVGGSFGLMFSVSLSKFTFSTGANYDKAPYLTPFDAYHSWYPFKYNPVNVSADCRVLDIPLNLDYQVYSKVRNQFSLGSGLSSYLMLSENYKYNYPYGYAYAPSETSIINQNQHFFGILNLDATYRRKLNSKLSLNIQPYVKIPLTDIGYSHVKLQTAGVAFGLSWNLNRLIKP